MRFNPGTAGFEPDLNSIGKREEKLKTGWFWLILLIILILLFVILVSYY